MFQAAQLDSLSFAQIAQELENAPMQEVGAMLDILRKRYPGAYGKLAMSPVATQIDWATAIRKRLAFGGAYLQPAVAAKNSGVALLNPGANSNKVLMVKRIEASVAAAGSLALYIATEAELLAGTSAFGVLTDIGLLDKLQGSNAFNRGGGIGGWSNAGFTGADPIAQVDILANTPWVFGQGDGFPFLLKPGFGLLVLNIGTLNQAMKGSFQFAELAVNL